MTRIPTLPWTLLLLLTAGLAPSALRADDAKADAGVKALQGTWVRAGDDGPESRWAIEGDTLKATVGGMEYTCALAADPKAKPHSTLDLTIKEGPADAVGKVSKAVYKFDGENLVLCVGLPGGERPAEFTNVDQVSYLFPLKREK